MTHPLSSNQQRVQSARLELHRESMHSPTVKGSATCSVKSARAPQRINTLTPYQGINDMFGERGSSSTEDQYTLTLSKDQCVNSLSARDDLKKHLPYESPRLFWLGQTNMTTVFRRLDRSTHLPPAHVSRLGHVKFE
ncbi:hypothetical protein CY34DRAFT_655938 [Suillus luteus UH-Slu-Lm8-n1]|uniref:Uncharacterized protein n=1 Tax=Suillus luteus UH-Slu-Lm8-n1 TaxID=930992 RepID=A0A0C9ZXI2_9AGAM|nr:hypothetical protein CY34DRAFT_655938 [Suillus luteus UH-Slu-Lm8-n1]